MRIRDRRGFSALEQLIVALTAGTIVVAAAPALLRLVEMARAAEAHQILGSLRMAEHLYFLEHGTFTDDPRRLYVQMPPDDSRSHFFRYAIALDSPSGFVLKATRKTGEEPGKGPNDHTGYTVTLSHDGILAGGP